MTLPAYALVTLDAAKDRLGVTDADRDSQIEGLIAEVSKAVLRATGREYAPQADADPRTLSVKDGASWIDLYPYEARAITSVTIDPNGTSPYVVAATDFQPRPISKPDGVYDRIQLASGVTTSSAFGRVEVEIVGDWGWTEVPEDVQGWVLEMVEDRWKNDFAFYADADGFVQENASGASGGPVTIPYRIRDEIESVKRVRLGSV